MSDARQRLARTFECAAEEYDAARPSYPDELFDDLVALADLHPGQRLVEIGCGTGKATRAMLERGFIVDCIEIGTGLAARARCNLDGLPVQIHLAPFETWEPGRDDFDLVYAATAWHWLDPELRYRKAHRLLLPGGHLAFWSALHAFPDDVDPFFVEIQEIYDAIGEPEGSWPPPPPDQVPDDHAEIQASGLFDGVSVRRYVWETDYTTEQYIALLTRSQATSPWALRSGHTSTVRSATGSTSAATGRSGATGTQSSTSPGAREAPHADVASR